MTRPILVLASLLVVAACSGGGGDGDASSPPHGDDGGLPDAGAPSDDAGGPAPADPSRVDPVATIHLIGRADLRDPAGPRFSWSGTEIRARFSGTGVTMKLADSGQNQFDVSIDGAAPTLLKTSAAVDYVLAEGLPDGEHDLFVVRRTEASFGDTQLLGITSAEGRPLVATPGHSSRRLEFVGDSISCGYGVLGSYPCTFSADTESEPDAFTGLTAKALGAQHATVAFSGLGVLRDYAGGTDEQMPARYTRSLADDPSSTFAYAFPPDAVVVTLGTNDFAQGDPGPAFQSATEAFLKTVRDASPSALVVVALTPMLSDAFPEGAQQRTKARDYLQGALEARKTAGDARLAFFEFDLQTGESGYGCDYHPNAGTQRAMAEKLTAFLAGALNW